MELLAAPASVKSRVIVSGHPPPIGDKTHPDWGQGEGMSAKEMSASPTKLTQRPTIVRFGQKHSPIEHQL